MDVGEDSLFFVRGYDYFNPKGGLRYSKNRKALSAGKGCAR